MNWPSVCCADTPSRAEARRRRITDAARKLFVEKGFHATGMAQLAKESGVAIGQIYRDFASKESIVAALVGADCRRLMASDTLVEAIGRRDMPAVRSWLRHFVEPRDSLEDGRLFAEIIAESSRNERIAGIFTGLQDALKEQILVALTLLAPGDPLADRRSVVADLAITLSLGLRQHQLLRPELDARSIATTLGAMLDHEIEAMIRRAFSRG